MTTEKLKADIDSGVALVESVDKWIPGTAKVNATLETLKGIAERPLVLSALAAALTAEGF